MRTTTSSGPGGGQVDGADLALRRGRGARRRGDVAGVTHVISSTIRVNPVHQPRHVHSDVFRHRRRRSATRVDRQLGRRRRPRSSPCSPCCRRSVGLGPLGWLAGAAYAARACARCSAGPPGGPAPPRSARPTSSPWPGPSLVGGVTALVADRFGSGGVPVATLVAAVRGRAGARRRRRQGRPAHRHGLRAGRALRHGGRRVPRPGAERARRACSVTPWVLVDRRPCATPSSRRAGCCRGCAGRCRRGTPRKVVAAAQGIVLVVASARRAAAAARGGAGRRGAGRAALVVRARA